MTPFVLSIFHPDDVTVFKKIEKTWDLLPDIDLGLDEQHQKIELSCHMLARAFATVFGLKYVDGFYKPRFCHSWLELPRKHVIDLYPVGTLGGPNLVDGSRGILSVVHGHYEKAGAKSISHSLRFSSNSFRRSVRKVTRIVRECKKHVESTQLQLI